METKTREEANAQCVEYAMEQLETMKRNLAEIETTLSKLRKTYPTLELKIEAGRRAKGVRALLNAMRKLHFEIQDSIEDFLI